jgi:hypothetical protein
MNDIDEGERDRRGSIGDRRERMRFERGIDRLIELWAREDMRRPHSAFYTDGRFIAWMAHEFRARGAMTEDDQEAELDEIAMRLYERALARRLGDQVVGVRPTERVADVPAPPSAAIAEARLMWCAPRYDLSIAAGAGRELWDEPCMSWIQLPPDLPSGDHVALAVQGNSMEPLIHSGDVVLVRLGGELAVDRLIVARGPDDGYVIKRVGRVLGPQVELRSLNPEFEPLLMPNDPSRVLGTVILRWCDHQPRSRRAGG